MSTLRPGEYQPTRDPGGAWDQEQTRQMEREQSWREYDRFHEVTPEHLVVEQRERIEALEECLADFERDFGCDHVTDESACCNSCHARRLLSQRVRVLPSRRG